MSHDSKTFLFIVWSGYLGLLLIGLIAGLLRGFTAHFPGRMGYINPLEMIIITTPFAVIPLVVTYATMSKRRNGFVLGVIVVMPLFVSVAIAYIYANTNSVQEGSLLAPLVRDDF